MVGFKVILIIKAIVIIIRITSIISTPSKQNHQRPIAVTIILVTLMYVQCLPDIWVVKHGCINEQ